MSISKKITLTIDGYTCKVSSNLQFFQGDSLHLIFNIKEYEIVINNNGTKTRELVELSPLRAFLLIETPENIDHIESVGVAGSDIHFHIGNKYTNFIGVSRMQIILLDETCCQVTLPEFNFEIRENVMEKSLKFDGITLN